MKSADICEMCGHHVAVRQKAHIVADTRKKGNNILTLYPTCHIMFDTHVKPKVFKALWDAGLRDLPESWKRSIYEEAAEASAVTLRKRMAPIEERSSDELKE